MGFPNLSYYGSQLLLHKSKTISRLDYYCVTLPAQHCCCNSTVLYADHMQMVNKTPGKSCSAHYPCAKWKCMCITKAISQLNKKYVNKFWGLRNKMTSITKTIYAVTHTYCILKRGGGEYKTVSCYVTTFYDVLLHTSFFI